MGQLMSQDGTGSESPVSYFSYLLRLRHKKKRLDKGSGGCFFGGGGEGVSHHLQTHIGLRMPLSK